MLPDTGERYLTTNLFEDVPAEMTSEEIGIARSTPNYRFDEATPTPDAGTSASARTNSAASLRLASTGCDRDTWPRADR